MSIDTAIARFRARQAEQFMTQAIVYRPIGEASYNTVTEEFDQDYDVVYSGPCKIRPSRARSSDEADAGETLIGKPDSEGKFPVDTDIERDDLVVVTASAHDQGLVGRTFTVQKAAHDEWQIARVAQLEETLPPLLNGSV